MIRKLSAFPIELLMCSEVPSRIGASASIVSAL
jgi:hypothetical protein